MDNMDKKQWTVDEAVTRFWEMAETANVNTTSHVFISVAGHKPITVLDGRNIWMYVFGGKWTRWQVELSSPEAAERRLDSTLFDDSLVLTATNGEAAGGVMWLNTFLNAQPAPVKWGFVRCGDGTDQPGLTMCKHVFAGAPVKDYCVPVPYQAKYGEALCADCIDGKCSEDDRFIACYRCYLRSQNRIRVTETCVVVGNDGENADITRDGDDAKFHFHRPVGMSVADFRAAYPVDKIVELSRMVEQGMAPKGVAASAA